jgi:hypothetical protein
VSLSSIKSGNYSSAASRIKNHIESIRKDLVDETNEKLEQFNVSDGEARAGNDPWDVYLNFLDAAGLRFDKLGTPEPANFTSRTPTQMGLSLVLRTRLEEILTKKRAENDARRKRN